MNGRDELDERDGLAVEDLERLGGDDQGDRAAVPDVLVVAGGVAFEQGPDVHVLVPLRHAEGEVAELVRADVDAAVEETACLLRGERAVVTDDVAQRIGHCRLLSATTLGRVGERTHQAALGVGGLLSR